MSRALKMTPEHQKIIMTGFRKMKANHADVLSEHYAALKADNRVKDIHMRMRWDIFSAAQRQEYIPAGFINDVLYAYLNDEHIDSMLKRAIVENKLFFS